MRHFSVVKPLSIFDNLDRDIDRFLSPDAQIARSWKPISRVKEEERYFHLTLDIPGVDKEHLKVEIKDSVLNISGEREDHFVKDNNDVKAALRFEQRFSLPKGIDQDEIEVHQKDGVLDVVIPKSKKQNESKSIEVKVGRSPLLS